MQDGATATVSSAYSVSLRSGVYEKFIWLQQCTQWCMQERAIAALTFGNFAFPLLTQTRTDTTS